MPRLMSVAMTADAVRSRQKTVTRRKGWWLDKNGRRIIQPGDRLTLCEKVQGRKPGEPLVRIADVEVVSVRREGLASVLSVGELEREGCGHLTSSEFIQRYFWPQGVSGWDLVTRIEWRYV